MPPESAAAAPAATAPPPSVHERLKAFLNPPAAPGSTAQGDDPAADEAAPGDDQADSQASVARTTARAEPPDSDDAAAEPATREDGGEDDDAAETDREPSDDEPPTDLQLSTVKDLADATGLDLEKILDLSLPTKVNGKDGTASVRDMLRSYQLDEHHNQKLASLDNDRKLFEGKRREAEQASNERLLRLDAGIKTLERDLIGEFASVDWQKLESENPSEFNSKYVAYQHRYARMQEIAGQIAAEQKQARAGQEAQAKAWLEDQKKLLKAKVPEWSDDTRRAKDKAEILDYLKGVGIPKEEFEQLGDHRYALVVRDAWKYAQLQKSRPSTLKKVKAAPKLLKPGTTQSRESREQLQVKQDRARLRQTGKVRDAVPSLKRILGAAQR